MVEYILSLNTRSLSIPSSIKFSETGVFSTECLSPWTQQPYHLESLPAPGRPNSCSTQGIVNTNMLYVYYNGFVLK